MKSTKRAEHHEGGRKRRKKETVDFTGSTTHELGLRLGRGSSGFFMSRPDDGPLRSTIPVNAALREDYQNRRERDAMARLLESTRARLPHARGMTHINGEQTQVPAGSHDLQSWHYHRARTASPIDATGFLHANGLMGGRTAALSSLIPQLYRVNESDLLQSPSSFQALAQAHAIHAFQDSVINVASLRQLPGRDILTLGNFGIPGLLSNRTLSHQPLAANTTPASPSSARSDAGKPMALPSDEDNLSEYQCLIRAQIDLFEARTRDIECNAQGRNKPIALGQVGIRCRHCSFLPPGRRPRGAVYFPAKLPGLYQAAQNMAINHFSESCQAIPECTRSKLLRLKELKTTVLGGGKQYWANGARVLGIKETDHGLVFDLSISEEFIDTKEGQRILES
ncbi:predicted protein [Phaeodactylum tricornutum CCAP 1055/1]|uniref:Uncharacterized protein n=1 Tax=Phaeodactylum tricornutum (strain CCAP 1055/1) TaxID=556484 RepID=B7G928_PHATC|nr:predicted protein [Phaeodactylum tricornutum CCAP 1055/1]EEC44876.1 predicted protein [Phaeodactylum tricornutum CCAP 1055/1]|eukprot:XP_002183694.1 predicted protein [Phaeodactylum tricornutum CCAP 1055/1]